MSYRRRASPLHAARASVACAYCAALAAAALVVDHPLLLGAALAAVFGAGAGAGVARDLGRAARLALPLALLVALVNPLVTREGLTVIARLGELPWAGSVDVTLEATAYGAVLGLRALVLIECFALYTAAVDPDELLAVFRRLSFRSALTATLATRMVPVLARDSRRLADAQRCRPDGRVPRLAVVRAAAAGALERAVDVAATLELRGYAGAHRPARRRAALSRHDLAFGAAAVAVVSLSLAARLGGQVPFEAYPRLELGPSGPALALATALVVCALAPLAQRRGISR